jgi:tetratricopeptide (TPR) repeat protein
MLRPSVALLGSLLVSACSDRGPEIVAAEYVSDESCASCHAYEYETWTGSHHDLAMQEATEETVLGDFSDVEFEHRGELTRFFRDGDAFMVRTTGPDGAPADYEVRWTFGVEPLQQYLIELEHGRVQCLTVAWDTGAERWFHLYPEEDVPFDDPLHWTGRYQRWNAMCAECHSTDLVRNYDAATDAYRTTFTEIDVGCQACHGPGSAHVAWGEADEAGEAPSDPTRGLVTNLRRHAQAAQMNACSPCHSRRTRLTETPEPGGEFLDHYLPERLHAGFYHTDGQILDEVYVYGSFAQSKMYQRGVACTDCHDPHNLEMLSPGNGVCTQCHTTAPPEDRFPTLPARDYDTHEHHHHAVDSEAAQCVSCHMPERTYMVVDPRRDHSMRVPRPDLTELLGTPNACNGCHVEETPAWAATAVEEWFGPERPRHFGPVFAAARAQVPDAGAILGGISADPEEAPIVRATALELLRGYGRVGLQAVVAALEDPEPLVRTAAVGSLDALPAEARGPLGAPLLTDSVRSVRIEAARALASVAESSLPEGDRKAFDAAMAEFVGAQEVMADMPSSHFNLAVVAADAGRAEEAEAAYRKALELDPYFLPARFNLATFLNSLGRNKDAEALLREGTELVPDQGELFFSLALLLAEMRRMRDATEAMQRAATLSPDRPRVHYNLGLLLQGQGRRVEAESAFLTAIERAPQDLEALHALVLFYEEGEEWTRALPHAERLAELAPEAPVIQELVERVRTLGTVGPRPDTE